MNTCGTCKHFGKLVEGLDRHDSEGEELPNTRYHQCMLLQHMNGSSQKPLAEAAGVVDGSGYFAVLCVSEEFGCNQWVPPTSEEHP